MRWQSAVLGLVLFAGGMLLGWYFRQPAEPVHSTADERLQPATAASGDSASVGTIYLPVYSTLFLGVGNRENTVDLAVTASVRNVSVDHPIVLESVRYYDSVGKRMRDYLDRPSTLPPLGSVEFIVQRSETAGGPGANFVIRWRGEATVDEPLVEAIMLGQSGNAGVSFSSRGRSVTAGTER